MATENGGTLCKCCGDLQRAQIQTRRFTDTFNSRKEEKRHLKAPKSAGKQRRREWVWPLEEHTPSTLHTSPHPPTTPLAALCPPRRAEGTQTWLDFEAYTGMWQIQRRNKACKSMSPQKKRVEFKVFRRPLATGLLGARPGRSSQPALSQGLVTLP